MKKVLFLIFFTQIFFLFAQEALKSTEEEYYDFLSLQGLVERPTLGYRTLSDSVWEIPENTEHVWQNNNLGSTRVLWQSENQGNNWFTKGFFHGFKYKLFGPDWFNSFNTAVPYGQNDGALWQGRGYNTSLTTGARIEGYGFELTFKPMVTFSQNLGFEINSEIYRNQYLYSFTIKNGDNIIVNHIIDFVQRYGDDAFFDYSFCDSEIRWNWNTFTIGFGTQSPWLGTAQLNPMLGSNNATPYPKLDIGLRKTPVTIPFIDLYIGDIEGRVWTGMLSESNYFDDNPNNNKRMLNAMSASYSPSFIPGFTFGLNRIFITYWKPKNLSYILRLFTTSRSNALASSGNDEDQKFSIFIDWKFDNVGFEVYGEFGRDDFSSSETRNPFHTAIYTIGARQIIPLPWGLSSQLSFEWNNFEMSQDFQIQWPYLGYYAHGFVSQGYTNNGQILGAGSGAFGNSQYIGYKIFFEKGYVDLFWHRYCPNNNSVYSVGVYTSADITSDLYNTWYANFETYNSFGFNVLYYISKSFSIKAGYTINKISNRNYIDKTEFNHNFSLELKYNF